MDSMDGPNGKNKKGNKPAGIINSLYSYNPTIIHEAYRQRKGLIPYRGTLRYA